MEEMAIKKFVAQKLHEGVKLSDIQNLLASELNCKMTFLDLRLLAAELEDVDWKQFDAEDKKPAEKAVPAASGTAPMPETAAPEPVAAAGTDAGADAGAAAAPGGTTQVELSRLARPGALAHGTVKFASGATAEWLVDEMGRLGLDKVVGKPTENDVVEFQKELQKLFR